MTKTKENKKNINIGSIITYVALAIAIGASVFLFINNLNDKKEIKKLNDNVTELNKSVDDLKVRMDEVNPPTKSVEETNFKTIKPSEIADESKDETIVAMIGRADCGWCHRFIPVLEDASKEYNFTPRYIDLYAILNNTTWKVSDEKEHKALINIKTTDEYKNFMSENFGATPLTLIIKDGTVINAISGYVKLPDLRTKLEESGFTK